MTVKTLDVVLYTFAFVVPGYIVEEIMSSLMPMKRQDSGVIVRSIAFSVLNAALWMSWLFKLLQKLCSSETVLYWVILSLLVLLTGSMTGCILGIIRATDFIRKTINKALRKFGISMEHPIPTAWDYRFKYLDEGAWITVRMDNEKFIRGRYYTNSFASSDYEYRDLYLEEAYRKDENEQWIKIKDTQGVWISPNAIKHIELTRNKESNRDGQ